MDFEKLVMIPFKLQLTHSIAKVHQLIKTLPELPGQFEELPDATFEIIAIKSSVADPFHFDMDPTKKC